MRRLITFETGPAMYHTGVTYAYPNILTAGGRGRVLQTAEYLTDVKTVENATRGKTTVHGSYRGMHVTVFTSGEGTPSVSCTLPEVIEACGDNSINIIRIGTAGGLQEYLKLGDLVVVGKAVRQDNTSDRPINLLQYLQKLDWDDSTTGNKKMDALFHRVKALYRSSGEFGTRIKKVLGFKGNIKKKGYSPSTDNEASAALLAAAKEKKIPSQSIYTGPCDTTPEIYCNTLLGGMNPHGNTIAVSMEESALCIFRDFYNIVDRRDIKIGSLLMIADKVFGESSAGDWENFLKNKKEIEKVHILSGLEALFALRKAG